MKPDNITRLKLRWQMRYRARTLADTLAGKLRRLTAGAALALRRSAAGARRLWRTSGYYSALALLLILLGSAAYAYRQRPHRHPAAQAAATPEPPAAAVWGADPVLPTRSPEPTPAPFALLRPVPGEVITPYAPDSLGWSEALRQWQTHPGLDLAAEMGEAVCAAEAGEVIGAYRDPLLGCTIEIRHANGWVTRYASLNTLNLVAVGQAVARGEIISAAGESGDAEAGLGAHVHFELRIDGSPADPGLAAAAD